MLHRGLILLQPFGYLFSNALVAVVGTVVTICARVLLAVVLHSHILARRRGGGRRCPCYQWLLSLYLLCEQFSLSLFGLLIYSLLSLKLLISTAASSADGADAPDARAALSVIDRIFVSTVLFFSAFLT